MFKKSGIYHASIAVRLHAPRINKNYKEMIKRHTACGCSNATIVCWVSYGHAPGVNKLNGTILTMVLCMLSK